MFKPIEQFDVKATTEKLINAIRQWFSQFSDKSIAVVGISGGKDSSVVAALCAKALGQGRVIGVLMPDGEQKDIVDSYRICAHLGIRHEIVNIRSIVNAFNTSINVKRSEQAVINLPPRIRMSTLYFIAQSNNGLVLNTCNYSEDYVGYCTKYGDAAGDYGPLKNFLTDEVIAIGRELGLPEDLLVKAPSDGLCGKTDEDNLGFSYAVLNEYIRTGNIENPETKAKIDRMHEANLHKERVIDRYERDDLE